MLGWSALGGDPIGGLNRLFVRKGDRQLKILHALRSVGDAVGEKEETVVALAWVLAHPSGIVPLVGSTNTGHVNTLLRALDVAAKISTDQWWQIGNAGGLCPLADSQCNYAEYMAKDLSNSTTVVV